MQEFTVYDITVQKKIKVAKHLSLSPHLFNTLFISMLNCSDGDRCFEKGSETASSTGIMVMGLSLFLSDYAVRWRSTATKEWRLLLNRAMPNLWHGRSTVSDTVVPQLATRLFPNCGTTVTQVIGECRNHSSLTWVRRNLTIGITAPTIGDLTV